MFVIGYKRFHGEVSLEYTKIIVWLITVQDQSTHI